MKNIFRILFVLLFIISTLDAQTPWYLIGNAPPFGSYLGTTNAQPLLLKTEQLQDIKLFTNSGGGTFDNCRMVIKDQYFQSIGLIGIGDMGTNGTFLPTSVLHQHRTNATSHYHQFTNDNTGVTATDGFHVGLAYNGIGLNPSGNITLREIGPIFFSTSNTLNGAMTRQRMVVTQGNFRDQMNNIITPNVSRIGINFAANESPNYEPLSSLHISSQSIFGNLNQTGYRNWMNLGTLVNNGCHIYTGMKDEAQNRSDGVLCWGDDINSLGAPDFFRIIFTEFADSSNGFPNPASHSRSFHGMEVFRASNTGNIGIGNFYINGINTHPTARFEILDNDPNSIVNANTSSPQLRLTYAYNSTVTAGIHTDFQTTNLGDMQINTNNVNAFARVGINNGTNILTRTLDVNGNLRLRTLPQAAFNANGNAAINRVLVSNADGEVFWRDDIGVGGGGISGCPGGLPTNFLTKATAGNIICNTVVHENYNHDIGIGVVNSSNSRLFVFADDGAPNHGDNAHGIYVRNFQDLNSTNTNARSLYSGDLNVVNAQIGTGLRMNVTTNTGAARGLNLTTISTGGPSTGILNEVQGNGTAAFGLETRVNPGPGTSTNCKGVKASCESANSTNNYGGNFTSTNASSRNWALIGYASSSNASEIIGVKADALRTQGYAGLSYGVKCSATGGSLTGTNYGCYSTSANAGINYGVYGHANIGSIASYGIYGIVNLQNCTTGTCPSAAGYFNGGVYSVGGYFGPSDSILKKNVSELKNSLALLNQLSPKMYEYDNSKIPQLNLAKGLQYGLISQDVEKVLPEIVSTIFEPDQLDDDGTIINKGEYYKALNYIELIPILIAGIKEQQTQIEDLKNQISNCCSSNSKTKSNQIDVELSNSQTIILDQNNPNPYKDETTIRFNIPTSVQQAAIIFVDAKGTVLKEVTITEKGAGSIHVYAPDLSSGIYTYTLIADGKVIDSKKMMKQ
ncbi:MAG: tail fiber domain-containing protein [Bacteroidetes bacterium]|nr:tail fiber domain-containing protein [Bacteroidota bacterium]